MLFPEPVFRQFIGGSHKNLTHDVDLNTKTTDNIGSFGSIYIIANVFNFHLDIFISIQPMYFSNFAYFFHFVCGNKEQKFNRRLPINKLGN